MKQVLIRDDDINYFTKIDWLELLYGKFLERNIPLNFSVIPITNCNLLVSNARAIYRIKENLCYEPFLPPQVRGKTEEYEIGENVELINFFKKLNKTEILQHGFKHEYINNEFEFGLKNILDLDSRIFRGRRILERAFDKEINFFSPPWDYLSKTGLLRLKKANFKGVSLYKIYKETLPPLISRFLNFHQNMEYTTFHKFLIVKHPGYIFSRFNSPTSIKEQIEQALRRSKILVIVNHHWEYFFDWDGLDEDFFNVWNRFIEALLQRDDIEFLNFTTLYHKLIS